MTLAVKQEITLESLTKAWHESRQPGAFGICGTYSRLGTCSDMWCPQNHVNYSSGPPTMKDVIKARKRQRDRERAKSLFSPPGRLPSEAGGSNGSRDWVRCRFCGRFDLNYDRANHKCDVKRRLPENVVRKGSHDLRNLPGYFLATKFGSPATVALLDRPYLLRDGDLRDYETRVPIKEARGNGKSPKYFVRIHTGSSFYCVISPKRFQEEFKQLPDDVVPNGWGGIKKRNPEEKK